jgi:hypothetical protein
MNNVKRRASRHIRNKEREYLKEGINVLESNSKNKNVRDMYTGINVFKKQPRTNLVKDEKGDLLVDPHKILNRWKKYFCQLLNIHGAGGVRQPEMHTAEPFVPQPSDTAVGVAIGKLKKCKSPGVDQIPAELIQAGRETLHSRVHKVIMLSVTKKICLTSGNSLLCTYSQKGR